MTSKLVSLLLLALSLAQPVVRGDAAADLATGIRQVEEGELDAAILTLDGVVRRLIGQQGREKELAQAHLYLGRAFFGLRQAERAEDEIRKAWKADRLMAVDPEKFPAEFVALCEKARGGREGRSTKVALLLGAGAAAGVTAAVAGGDSAASSAPTATPAPSPNPTPSAPATPVPTPTPTPSPEHASTLEVYLVGPGRSARREVQVGTGTLRARFDGKGSQVQIIINDPSGSNVAVDTQYPESCSSLSVTAEASTEVVGGTYAVVFKVDPRRPSACCTEPLCRCKIPDCHFAVGQVSIFYPAP